MQCIENDCVGEKGNMKSTTLLNFQFFIKQIL